MRTERDIQAVGTMGAENEETKTQEERVLNHLDHTPSHPMSSGSHLTTGHRGAFSSCARISP